MSKAVQQAAARCLLRACGVIVHAASAAHRVKVAYAAVSSLTQVCAHQVILLFNLNLAICLVTATHLHVFQGRCVLFVLPDYPL